MANALYDAYRDAQVSQTTPVDWDADNVKVILVDTGAYTVNLATHDFLDDVPAGARIATSANLAGKTSAAGVADATDIVFSSVSGTTVEALVLYKDTGTESTSRLIAYIDTATGLPLTPNGADVTVTWDNGANKIFKI